MKHFNDSTGNFSANLYFLLYVSSFITLWNKCFYCCKRSFISIVTFYIFYVASFTEVSKYWPEEIGTSVLITILVEIIFKNSENQKFCTENNKQLQLYMNAKKCHHLMAIHITHTVYTLHCCSKSITWSLYVKHIVTQHF